MEDDERSVSYSDDSTDTVEYCPRRSEDHSKNGPIDLSNEENRRNSDLGLHSRSVPQVSKRGSVVVDRKEVEAKDKYSPETPLATIAGYQQPMNSIRSSEDLRLMNGIKEAEDIIQNCKSTSPAELERVFRESSGPSLQQLVTQPQDPAIPSVSPQSSDRVPTMQLQLPSDSPSKMIGCGVLMSAVRPSQRVPQLPPCIKLSKRPMPPVSEGPEAKRREEPNHPPKAKLPDVITLITQDPPKPQKNNLADLANRGITVVAGSRPQTMPGHLNSSVSITRSPLHQRVKAETKPVLSTVDLTKESDTPRRFLNRAGRPRVRSVCQICDKGFATAAELSQHMTCHRDFNSKFECRECTAQYTTEAALQAHRQKYHGAGGPTPDMALPVVDLKQPGVLAKLTQLGIRSVIPLSQLHSGSGGGMFGLPVVALDSASNPAICNIGGLGASNLLPMGPLKNVSFNNNMR